MNFNISSGIYWFIGRSAAIIFVFLVGVSLSINYSKNKKITKFLERGLKIFAIGLLITGITWLLFPQNFILFGILHLIGLSIIISYPFLKYNKLNLILGLIIISIGLYLLEFTGIQELLWLYPFEFYTFDYFPLFPWFGLVLLGIFTGNYLYKGKRKIIFENKLLQLPIIQKIGRHSLLIYLIHQPILIGMIHLLLI